MPRHRAPHATVPPAVAALFSAALFTAALFTAALLATTFLATMLLAPAVSALTLQEVWDRQAHSEAGCDHLVHLDSLEVYTSGLWVNNGERNCIRGHGAILDLEGDGIVILHNRTKLDLEGCVILNGGTTVRTAAVSYKGGTGGHVRNCVFYENYWGLHMDEVWVNDSGVAGCIFMANTLWGVVLHDIFTPPLRTTDACANGPGLTPVAATSWGRIKATFAGPSPTILAPAPR